jgi:hypothetical protein
MDTDLSANWSSRKPQTGADANPIRKLNVTATQNLPETSSAVHASGSYRADSTTLGGSQQSGTIQHFIGTGTEPRTEKEQSMPEAEKKGWFKRIKSLAGKGADRIREASLPQFRHSAEWTNSNLDFSSSPPQLEPMPVSTEEIPFTQSAPPPLSEGQAYLEITPPGFIDPSDRVHRQQQVPGDGRCVECAMNTVLHFFFGKKEIMETEEFKQQIAGKYPTAYEIKKIARKKGLKIKRYRAAKLGEAGIDDAKAFFISVPGSPPLFHTVAMVQYEGFHLSDSGDQDKAKSEIYPGIARHAIFDYQRRHNVAARAVTTFHKRVPPHSPEFNSKDTYNDGCEFFDNEDWKEAIEEFDEVIMCLWKAKDPEQRVLLANAFHNKGTALCKLKKWSRAIEAYKVLETCFGKEESSELRELLAMARRYNDFALSKLFVHGDGEQAGAERP